MDLKYEASPFINTAHSKKAKEELYSIGFRFEHIGNVGGKEPIKRYGFLESDDAFNKRHKEWETKEKDVFFDGWTCKDMGHFHIFEREYDDTVLHFEFDTYTISTVGKHFEFPAHPDTIDDFICDCKRVGVKLFWRKEILDTFLPDSVTSDTKVLEYYKIVRDNMRK